VLAVGLVLIAVAVISLNSGLFLMCLFDLFPAGIHQLNAVMEHGYWYARSEQFIQGIPFQLMTWARIVGGAIFVLGGVLPIAWFVISRYRAVKVAAWPGQPCPAGQLA